MDRHWGCRLGHSLQAARMVPFPEELLGFWVKQAQTAVWLAVTKFLLQQYFRDRFLTGVQTQATSRWHSLSISRCVPFSADSKMRALVSIEAKTHLKETS